MSVSVIQCSAFTHFTRKQNFLPFLNEPNDLTLYYLETSFLACLIYLLKHLLFLYETAILFINNVYISMRPK